MSREKEPVLIIVCGAAGAGKSTVGRCLAKRLGWVYLDKDTATQDYTDYILRANGLSEDGRESAFYKQELMPLEYVISFRLCRDNLELGNSVVMTIPFVAQIRDASLWEDLRHRTGIPDGTDVRFVWISQDPAQMRQRILARGERRDAYKLAHWEIYEKGIINVTPDARYGAYACENRIGADPEKITKEIMDHFKLTP